MSVEAPRAPLCVYMLADHLDSALAAGEDLISAGARWRALAEGQGEAAQDLSQHIIAERKIAEDARGFELMLIARALKAREHAGELSRIDSRFGPIANLFVSGTAILLDAVAECGDATLEDFETGDSLIAYVRARGMIAPDAATVTNAAQLTIDDSFMVAKRLALGPLLDMVAAFLDALELHYDLFAIEDEDDDALPVAQRQDFGRRERAPVN